MCQQFTYSGMKIFLLKFLKEKYKIKNFLIRMKGCDSNSNNFENEEDCRKICNAREIGKYFLKNFNAKSR